MSDKIDALAISGAIRGISKLYQELELESLMDKSWLRQMSYLYKIVSTKLPPYKGHIDTLTVFKTLFCRTALFQNLSLLFTIIECNKLNSGVDSHAIFHKKLLNFISPLENDDACGV